MKKTRLLYCGILLFTLASLLSLGLHNTNAVSAATNSTITISFINVGQGDSFLIRDATGFDVLIDGGKPTAGPIVLGFLRSQGIDDIDVMLATHADSDHIGGLIDILNAVDIPVEAVFYNGYLGSTTTWNSFTTAVTNERVTLIPAQYPEEFSWGQMTFTIINPVTGLTDPEQNDVSVVALLIFGQNRLLFTGDVSSSIEAEILGRGVSIDAQVLKVAHHGSSTSTSSSFLAQVTPQQAVISVGDNSYGHPSSETLTRLQEIGADIWRTDFAGNIVVTCDGTICTFPNKNRVFLTAVMQLAAGGAPFQTGRVIITNIFYDGSGSAEPDEYVEIQNQDTVAIQLQNWTLQDNANHTFTFPPFIIQPNQVCRVYTNENHPEWCSFNYAQSTSIWNNTGDCAFLRNTQSIQVDDYCYTP